MYRWCWAAEAVRDALIAFMAVTAQAEAAKAAQKTGITAAKQTKTKYHGKKPSYDRKTMSVVVDMLGKGAGASEISEVTGLSRQTVLRIRTNPSTASQALYKWQL